MREPLVALPEHPLLSAALLLFANFAVSPLGTKRRATPTRSPPTFRCCMGDQQCPSGPPSPPVPERLHPLLAQPPGRFGGLARRLDCQFGLAAGAEISRKMDPARRFRQPASPACGRGRQTASAWGQSFDDAVLGRLAAATGAPTCLKPAAGWPQAQRAGRWAAGAST